MAETLCMEHATVGYEKTLPPILRDIRMELRPGALLGVIGPNGSGKSTLVRSLSRVLRPLHGATLLDGLDLYAEVTARQSAQAIGVVPQSSSAVLEFTVRDLVEMGRGPHLPASPFATLQEQDIRIVDHALRDAGVAEMSGRRVTSLSGGEWQRVLLARALAQQPNIFLLDEPTAHLDIRHQRHVLSLARGLAHSRGKAVLAVLHDLNLAAEFCDTLALVNEGQIVVQDAPREVLTETNIERVYGERVWVRPHPLTRRPQVLTVPPGETVPDAPHDSMTVHVLCGAGTGAGLMVQLLQNHYTVTCGMLNTDDTDAQAAEWLRVPYAGEAPFTPMTPPTLARAKQLAMGAGIVVLTDIPIGPANIAVLRIALEARHSGIPVCCLQPPAEPFSSRDYTQGDATRLWDELQSAGAACVPDTASLLQYLEQKQWKL